MPAFSGGRANRRDTLSESNCAMSVSAASRLMWASATNSGNVCCTPEMPPHTLKKFESCFMPGGDGEWSEPTVVTSPASRQLHKVSRADEERNGGAHFATAPRLI